MLSTISLGRTVKVLRRPKKLVEEDFNRRQRIASALEAVKLLLPNIRKKKVEKEVDDSLGELFKIDTRVECDYEGKGNFWPCIVRRVNDNRTYDIEYINDFKWVGVQRGIAADLVQKLGEGQKKQKGEGVWHWVRVMYYLTFAFFLFIFATGGYE